MKLVSLVLVAALGASAIIEAQQAPPPSSEVQAARAAVRKSCASDVQSMCAGKTGREAMMCLRSNADKLSPDCKEALSKLPPPGSQQGTQPH